MPFDQEDLIGLEGYRDRRRREFAPSRDEKIRWYTVMCLIFNRGIGSGIFVTPGKIIKGVNSIGFPIVLWAIGGLLILCGTLVWIEFGLSIPREEVEGQIRSVPRSGGEKNYLEWVLQRPRFLATCMYGIVFIILGNLSGNSIAFGQYVMLSAGYANPRRGPVIGLAILALTSVALLHTVSRRGGIVVNNILAVIKVCILLMIIIVGFAVRGGRNFNNHGARPIGASFEPSDTFANSAKNVSTYSNVFLMVMYTYSGFEQPFYVLSEVDRPRRNFAKAVLTAMGLLTLLFILTNIAYVCVIPLEVITNPENARVDIASLFFERLFGNNIAKHVMQAMIAISIFGNLVVMTFTAARVKQEIAKEGILPKSLFFASGKSTPMAILMDKLARRRESKKRLKGSGSRPLDTTAELDTRESEEHLEQSPMAALFLHWYSSVFLVAVTAKLQPTDSYTFLISLYSYVIVLMMGFFTSLGLLYAKYIRKDFVSEYPVWGGPTAAIVFCICNLFVLVTNFLRQRTSSPVPWYMVPTIGMSTVVWGLVWWLGLQLVMRQRGQQLEVTRHPYCEMNGDEWVLKYEIIDHDWKANSDTGSTTNRHEGTGV